LHSLFVDWGFGRVTDWIMRWLAADDSSLIPDFKIQTYLYHFPTTGLPPAIISVKIWP
jgi:hypothetical protein